MIQMRYFRGGVIECDEVPADISLLMVHGFRQATVPADAETAILQTAENGVAECPANGKDIADALRAGNKITNLKLKKKEKTVNAG